MQVRYRGHEITVTREASMLGPRMIFWSIFRAHDQYECDSGFSDSTDTVRTMIRHLKARVDAELAESGPWGENARDAHV